MDELVSKQAAIDAIKDRYYKYGRFAKKDELIYALEGVPPAQPEIIFCKDCIHSDIYPKGADNDMPLKCLGIRYGGVMPDWYCEHAERRTE